MHGRECINIYLILTNLSNNYYMFQTSTVHFNIIESYYMCQTSTVHLPITVPIVTCFRQVHSTYQHQYQLLHVSDKHSRLTSMSNNCYICQTSTVHLLISVGNSIERADFNDCYPLMAKWDNIILLHHYVFKIFCICKDRSVFALFV